jgi:hypothetical protein
VSEKERVGEGTHHRMLELAEKLARSGAAR